MQMDVGAQYCEFCLFSLEQNGRGTMRKYLDFVGWTLREDGQLKCDDFLTCNILTQSPKEIFRTFRRAWPMVLLQQVARKGIGDHHLHPSMTMQVFSSLSERDQKVIIHNMVGGFQTGSQVMQWERNCDGSCILCGALDTRQHRVVECPTTNHVRHKHVRATQILMEERPEWQYLPMARRHEYQNLYYAFCNSVELTASGHFQSTGSETLILYTDGGGLHPTQPEYGLATWAIVQDVAENMDQRRLAADALFLQPPQFPYFRVAQAGFVD